MEPIKTIITNNTTAARGLQWLGKGTLWIGPGQSIEIAYEPWSCADRRQQTMLLAELTNKQVTLTLRVLTGPEQYQDIPYDPSIILGLQTPQLTVHKVQETPAAVCETAAGTAVPRNTLHTVTTDQNSYTKRLGFTSDPVTPNTDSRPSANAVGFQQSGAGIAGVCTTDILTRMNKGAGIAEEKEDTTESDFNAAVESKDWEKALDILINKYGREKITFTTRTIMSMKSYSAIVEKYKLS